VSWLLVLLTLALGAQARVVDRVVAVVNGEPITLSDLKKAILVMDEPKQGVDDLLQEVIEDRLLLQEARRLGLRVRDQEVDHTIQEFMKRHGMSHQAMEEGVQRQGMSWRQYREFVRREMLKARLVDQEVRSAVRVTEEEMRRFWKEHPERFREPERVHVQDLFLRLPPAPADRKAVRKLAHELYLKALAGVDFRLLALQHSQGPFDLGQLAIDELAPPLRMALQGLAPGETTPPVETPQGIHVLRLVKRHPGRLRPFEEVKEEVRSLLFQRKFQERYRRWVRRLRDRACIVINR